MDKIRILVAEDNIEWTNFYKDMFRNLFDGENIHTDYASSAKEGFNAVIKNNPYDLVISDLEMEQVFDEPYAGMWLVKNLKNNEKCKNTRFIIISAAYNAADIAKSLNSDYILKCFLLNNKELLRYKIKELFTV